MMTELRILSITAHQHLQKMITILTAKHKFESELSNLFGGSYTNSGRLDSCMSLEKNYI
jgi:hypothetical protein